LSKQEQKQARTNKDHFLNQLISVTVTQYQLKNHPNSLKNKQKSTVQNWFNSPRP